MKRVSVFAVWLIAGLLLPYAALSPAARADDAQALLAKHRAFVGWQFGDGSVTSLALERTLTDANGAVVENAVEHRAGLAYRRDYRSTKDYESGGATGFTGNVFWTTNANGFTVPMVGDVAKFYLAMDVLFMEGSTELPASIQGTATINGTGVQIIHITMNGAAPFDVYEDPATGAYLEAVVDPGGAQETTVIIHAYATLAPGKRIIGSWSLGDSDSVYTYTTLTMNPGITAADLHPPAPTATWHFANPNAFPILTTLQPGRVYVDAKINGVVGRFILDTGAGGITLTDDFANRVHIRQVDTSSAFGIGGITKTSVRKADTVEIGGNVLANVVVNSIPANFDNEVGRPDGLIGFDLFGGAIVDVSLSDQTMRIRDPSMGAASPGTGWYPVTPDLSNFTPRIPAVVNGTFSLMVMFDTGTTDIVVLSTKAEKNGLHAINGHSTFFAGTNFARGVGGLEQLSCGSIDKMQFGPFAYSSSKVCESPNWPLREGLVGLDFLKHFDYVFDYPHGIMYMKPRN
jgi:predicted aspartyl protease